MADDDSLRALPKVELHRHLDGSVRIATIHALGAERGVPLGTLEELTERAVLRRPRESLEAVLACFATQQQALWSLEAVRRVAFENVEDAWRDGIRLIELRFAPSFIAQGKELPIHGIIEAVADGVVQGAAAYPVQVGLIGILPRSHPLETNALVTRELIRFRAGPHPGARLLVGFDLADAEERFDPLPLVPLVDRARDAGMGITIHSGENTSAAHVARTLDLFRPDRVGHGIRAVDDPALVERLRDEDVLLEVSPTSNWITSAVPSLAAHPLPRLLRAGVPVCVNSDDPNLFGIDLVHEYGVCVRELGMSHAELHAMNQAALRHSFLPEDAKRRAVATGDPA
jgi:adenosine deaminase